MKAEFYKYLSLVLSVAALIASGIAIWKWQTQPRIAYVRSMELVYQYNGMKEAQNKYKLKKVTWDHQVDSLQTEFQNLVQEFKSSQSGGLAARTKEQLLIERNALEAHRKSIEETAAAEDKQLTEGVLNQVNSFVNKYGEQNGYDIILGINNSGNVLYGDSYLDLTQEILREMNKGQKN